MSKWSSTPTLFNEFKGIHLAAACFLVGLMILLISLYVLGTEIFFFHRATAFEATIVEVRREQVAAGRGSVLAYIPVVEIPNTGDRMIVDASSEENIFSVGARMNVLCDLSISQRCIRDTFFDKWWGLIDLALALLFLVPSFIYLRRPKRESQDVLTLNPSSE